ncbi:hypothetical protein SEEHRA23_09145 [Salmonella enterica subsp. enterica serovar Heidelberg str. SARA33]|nr:hypothetical protein SEEHRA23_09145 [Salmonella enterica subsp. enterica serovar Heidelberg str. SARA33]ESC73098.1 hypothetical protein SEEN4881_00967 [Salmonella enterica subsp. enterica serovar Newport str. WA_14881]
MLRARIIRLTALAGAKTGVQRLLRVGKKRTFLRNARFERQEGRQKTPVVRTAKTKRPSALASRACTRSQHSSSVSNAFFIIDSFIKHSACLHAVCP